MHTAGEISFKNSNLSGTDTWKSRNAAILRPVRTSRMHGRTYGPCAPLVSTAVFVSIRWHVCKVLIHGRRFKAL